MDGYWVILSGRGGELAREFVAETNDYDDVQDELNIAVRKVIGCGLNEGDTISIRRRME
jgi:hypothetical protein